MNIAPQSGDSEQVLLVKIAAMLGGNADPADPPQVLLQKIGAALSGVNGGVSGATPIGTALITLVAPGATSFLQFNQNATVSVLTAGAMRTAISAAASGANGDITSLTALASLKPATDGVTAIQVFKADGTTLILDIDSTNGRVGIGTNAPGEALHLKSVVSAVTLRQKLEVTATNAFGEYQMMSDACDFRFGVSGSTSSGGGNAYIGTYTAGRALSFYSGGSIRMRLHGSGGFSVGNTTDPGAGNVSLSGTLLVGNAGVAISRVRFGAATLASGTVTVADTNVTASTKIFAFANDNAVVGILREDKASRVAGTSFKINSSASDAGVISYLLIEP